MLKTVTRILSFLLVLVLSSCGGRGGGNQTSNNNSPLPSTNNTNVAPVIMDSGPDPSSFNAVNEVFTSITICDSVNENNCQTINHILVDTMSNGLRIMSSVLSPSLNLSQETDSNGNPIGECGAFADGYTWGPIKIVTLKIANETAYSIPMEVIGDPNFAAAPTACSSKGPSENTVSTFGANGIIGVGYFLHDCGQDCTLYSTLGYYYSCPSSGCAGITVPLSEQLPNPVSKFAIDNNGVILDLPSLTATGGKNVTGSLTFGIGTQSDNGLGSAKIYTVNSVGFLTTTFNGATISNSFIDSGSNTMLFSDPTLTNLVACKSNSDFYCPTSTQNYTATITGVNAATTNINFSVANANNLFATGGTAFNNLAGALSGGFDWGLPFFYGRRVYVAMEQQSVAGVNGPYIAF